jgi:ABC-type multidrug transport system ATPase subunit
MISTANITMQFGEKPLFENISIKFSDNNRYGLIGANGCGKSTFMKILTGELTPTSGTVGISDGERLGVLRQDQFAFEDFRVVDAVIMGHEDQRIKPVPIVHAVSNLVRFHSLVRSVGLQGYLSLTATHWLKILPYNHP